MPQLNSLFSSLRKSLADGVVQHCQNTLTHQEALDISMLELGNLIAAGGGHDMADRHAILNKCPEAKRPFLNDLVKGWSKEMVEDLQSTITFPNTCTKDTWQSSGCGMAIEFATNFKLGITLKPCPGNFIPSFAMDCVGDACKSVGKFCTSDSDCLGDAKCELLVEKEEGDHPMTQIISGLQSMASEMGVFECGKDGQPSCNGKQELLDELMSIIHKAVGWPAPAAGKFNIAGDVKVCGFKANHGSLEEDVITTVMEKETLQIAGDSSNPSCAGTIINQPECPSDFFGGVPASQLPADWESKISAASQHCKHDWEQGSPIDWTTISSENITCDGGKIPKTVFDSSYCTRFRGEVSSYFHDPDYSFLESGNNCYRSCIPKVRREICKICADIDRINWENHDCGILEVNRYGSVKKDFLKAMQPQAIAPQGYGLENPASFLFGRLMCDGAFSLMPSSNIFSLSGVVPVGRLMGKLGQLFKKFAESQKGSSISYYSWMSNNVVPSMQFMGKQFNTTRKSYEPVGAGLCDDSYNAHDTSQSFVDVATSARRCYVSCHQDPLCNGFAVKQTTCLLSKTACATRSTEGGDADYNGYKINPGVGVSKNVKMMPDGSELSYTYMGADSFSAEVVSMDQFPSECSPKTMKAGKCAIKIPLQKLASIDLKVGMAIETCNSLGGWPSVYSGCEGTVCDFFRRPIRLTSSNGACVQDSDCPTDYACVGDLDIPLTDMLLSTGLQGSNCRSDEDSSAGDNSKCLSGSCTQTTTYEGAPPAFLCGGPDPTVNSAVVINFLRMREGLPWLKAASDTKKGVCALSFMKDAFGGGSRRLLQDDGPDMSDIMEMQESPMESSKVCVGSNTPPTPAPVSDGQTFSGEISAGDGRRLLQAQCQNLVTVQTTKTTVSLKSSIGWKPAVDAPIATGGTVSDDAEDVALTSVGFSYPIDFGTTFTPEALAALKQVSCDGARQGLGLSDEVPCTAVIKAGTGTSYTVFIQISEDGASAAAEIETKITTEQEQITTVIADSDFTEVIQAQTDGGGSAIDSNAKPTVDKDSMGEVKDDTVFEPPAPETLPPTDPPTSKAPTSPPTNDEINFSFAFRIEPAAVALLTALALV
jgi:hypothetical protein